MGLFTYHTHETKAARARRKNLGNWDVDFAKAVWVTKEKREIRVRDMGDGHLLNTIKLLYRSAATKKLKDDMMFLLPPFPQGEMAQDAFDQECNNQFSTTSEEYVQDIYWDMMAEARVRGFDMEELAREFNRIEMDRFTVGLRAIRLASDLD